MPDAVHILLLRHGQTDDNAAGIIQGHSPTSLNELGHRQAQRLAQRVARWRPQPQVLISSDLPRAAQTASPIAQACRLRPLLDPVWRERGLGDYEGKTVGERELWRLASGDATPPGAETVDDFRHRVKQALVEVADRHTAGCVAVVTHGGPIRSILRMLSEGLLPLEEDHPPVALELIGNCAVMHLTFRRAPLRSWRVICLNDVAHLDGLDGAPATDAG